LLQNSQALSLWKPVLEVGRCICIWGVWSRRLQLLYLPPLDIPRDGIMEMTRNRGWEEGKYGFNLIVSVVEIEVMVGKWGLL
jgi:hypothetical protein